MNKFLNKLLALFFFLQVMLLPSMGQHTIDFSKSTNLKAVYDAGLRPWRFLKEMDDLNLTNESIRIVLPDASPFEMAVDICTLGVMAENQLSRADFSTDMDTLPAAAERTREICRALGIPTEDLDKAIDTFARMGDQSPNPQYWNARIKKGTFDVSVSFKPLFALGKTLGRVYVTLTFHDSSKPMKLLKEPVKPPPGYEHVSMDPPPLKPKPTQLPDPDDARRVGPFTPRNSHGEDTSPSVANISKEPDAHNSRLYVWFGIAAALAILAILILKQRLSSPRQR